MALAALLPLTCLTGTASAAERVELPCVASGPNATGPLASDFCWIDWSNLPLKDGVTPVRITVDGGHVDADLTLSHSSNSVLFVNDYTKHSVRFSKLIPAYDLTGNTALGFRQSEPVKADRSAKMTLTDITPVSDEGGGALADFQMLFGDAETMSEASDGAYESVDLTSDKPLSLLGWVGDDDPARSYHRANTGWGTTHVSLAGGGYTPGEGFADSAGAVVAGAKRPTEFAVNFRQHDYLTGDSAIAVGVYMPTVYPLIYDANGGNADGLPKQTD